MVKIKTSNENLYRIRMEIVDPIEGIEYSDEQTLLNNQVLYIPDIKVSKSLIEEQLLSQPTGVNIAPILLNTGIIRSSHYGIDETSIIDSSRLLAFTISSYYEFEYKEFTIKALGRRDTYLFNMIEVGGFMLIDSESITLDEALDTVTYDLAKHNYDISNIDIDELINRAFDKNINPEEILDTVEWTLLHDYLIKERDALEILPNESKYLI